MRADITRRFRLCATIGEAACCLVVLMACRSYDGIRDVEVPQTVPKHAVLGSFYEGDGLGFNLCLTIGSNGAYSCEWWGCMGLYGASTGRWSIASNRLSLTPSMESGMLKDHPLRALDVLLISNNIAFVDAVNNELFPKQGPSRYSCFSREDETRRRRAHAEAGAALAQEILKAEARIADLRSAIASKTSKLAVPGSEDQNAGGPADLAEYRRDLSDEEAILMVLKRKLLEWQQK